MTTQPRPGLIHPGFDFTDRQSAAMAEMQAANMEAARHLGISHQHVQAATLAAMVVAPVGATTSPVSPEVTDPLMAAIEAVIDAAAPPAAAPATPKP